MEIRSHVLAAFIGLGIASSCGMSPEPEPTPTSTNNGEPATFVDPETGATYLLSPNRRVVSAAELADGAEDAEMADGVAKVTSALRATFSDVDESGSVAVQLAVCDSGSPKTGVVGVGCPVDDDFVLVGGGAEDLYSGAGAMLFESRPAIDPEWGVGKYWWGQSKDHLTAANHVLHVWAIGLKLRKTDGTWMSAAELRGNISYKPNQTTTATAAPQTSCVVPAGQKIIGGGAKSLWQETGGVGQLLTTSFPGSATAWNASAKDHLTSSHAHLRVYCVGINSTIANFGSLLINRKSAPSDFGGGVRTATGDVTLTPRHVPTCYGGGASWTGNKGRLLFRMSPGFNNNRQFRASSKDHGSADSGAVTAWVVEVRKQ
jgi:hypothetical protein